jgi:hypothetical protein
MAHQLRPTALSWTALLGEWMDFARASLALPDDAEGRRWRDSITPIVTLQAVTFALRELDTIDIADRAHAAEQASVLINRQADTLDRIWGEHDAATPAMIAEILADAREEHNRATAITEVVWPGPEAYEVPDFGIDRCAGTLLVMQPGTLAMPGEPIAWWRDAPAMQIEVDRAIYTPSARARQVYRIIEHDRIVRDVIGEAGGDGGGDGGGDAAGDVERDAAANQPAEQERDRVELPLLVPLFVNGKQVGHFTLDRDEWLNAQRASLAGDVIPVEHIGT